MYHWSMYRCVNECVIISKDEAGLAGEWMKWTGTEGDSVSPRATSRCVSLRMRAKCCLYRIRRVLASSMSVSACNDLYQQME